MGVQFRKYLVKDHGVPFLNGVTLHNWFSGLGGKSSVKLPENFDGGGVGGGVGKTISYCLNNTATFNRK